MESAGAFYVFYTDFGGKCAECCAMDFNMVKMCLMEILLVYESMHMGSCHKILLGL